MVHEQKEYDAPSNAVSANVAPSPFIVCALPISSIGLSYPMKQHQYPSRQRISPWSHPLFDPETCLGFNPSFKKKELCFVLQPALPTFWEGMCRQEVFYKHHRQAFALKCRYRTLFCRSLGTTISAFTRLASSEYAYASSEAFFTASGFVSDGAKLR